MAELKLEKGSPLVDMQQIQNELTPLGVKLAQWSVGENPELLSLLSKPTLIEDEKEQVLFHLDHYFKDLETQSGYQSRDLIVLHPKGEGLSGLLKKFESCHTHDDDEVRFIVDGEGVFGFVRPDGSQLKLKIEAGEFINVPQHTEHWFELTDSKRIKAIRYFSGTEGWTPVYTQTSRRL